jgi:RNA 2',3'-cyclic 3'-phosphodiesterase
MVTVIRAFIAIDLPETIQSNLDRIIKRLDTPSTAAVHWVPASNIHLTLKFLGEISSSNLELLKKILQSEITRHKSFEISVGGIGAFPNIHRPRVIWVGIQAPPDLTSLQRAVEAETVHLGYSPEEREFSPHLTLGRVAHNATPQNIQQVAEALAQEKIGDLGKVCVKSVVLYRSDLQPSGAVYTPLFSTNLLVNSNNQPNLG